jgi:hypothetical protein
MKVSEVPKNLGEPYHFYHHFGIMMVRPILLYADAD